jgi:hypothetical protein
VASDWVSKKVACDIRRTALAAPAADWRSVALRVDLTQRPTAQALSHHAEKGSEGAWPESGFFILAML